MKIFRVIVSATIVLSSIQSAFSWDWNTHKVIATIASDYLQRNRPDVLLWVNGILANNEQGYNTMVDAAPYADLLKYGAPAGWPHVTPHPQYDKWHFIDYPIYFDQTGLGQPVRPPQRATNDVLYGIPFFEAELSGSNAPMAIAMVIHLVGDAHQPLHCATWCTDHVAKNYQGDAGGNALKVKFRSGSIVVTDLHALWDKALSIKYGFIGEHESDDILTAAARTIEQDVPVSSFGGSDKDLTVADWTLESYERAYNQAYKPHDDPLSDADYITNMEGTAEARACLAGTRLANLLISIHDQASNMSQSTGSHKSKKKKKGH